MGWPAVFTAFGVVVLGIALSLGLFIIEILTSRAGYGKKMLNAYNYQIDLETKPAIAHIGSKLISSKIEVLPNRPQWMLDEK